MNNLSRARRRLRATTKDLAYSPAARTVAARVAQRPEGSPTKNLIEAWNLQDSVRRLATEPLPSGKYYAKLTIRDWKKNLGREFLLFQNGVPIYGDVIITPLSGNQLEFRNFVVSSRDPGQFSLDIDVPYSITIGQGAFTTAAQEKYDAQHGLRRDGRLYFCLRGEMAKPRRIIFTFPNFAPPEKQVPYPVNGLSGLTEEHLRETLIVAFQDRYLNAGTYLLTDNSHASLKAEVSRFLSKTIEQYGLSTQDVLLYGTFKGASSALIHAKDFPEARLVLVSPHMHLGYFLNTPRFRHNLGQDPLLTAGPQPGELFSQYAGEREMDLIYTHSSERSNFSAVEFMADRPKLNRYRINASESEIGSLAMPTVLNIVQRFIGQTEISPVRCTGVKFFEDDDTLFAQVRLNPTPEATQGGNWYLVTRSGTACLHQLLSDHTYPFVKYTGTRQGFHRKFDPVEHLSEVVCLLPDGTVHRAELPKTYQSPKELAQDGDAEFVVQALTPDAPTPRQHAIVTERELSSFEYVSRPVVPDGGWLEIHVVHSMDGASDLAPSVEQTDHVSHLAVVRPLDSLTQLRTFIQRMAVLSGAEHLRIILDRDDLHAEDLRRLGSIEWEQPQIVAVKPVAEFDEHAEPFSSWLASGRLTLSMDPGEKPSDSPDLRGRHR